MIDDKQDGSQLFTLGIILGQPITIELYYNFDFEKKRSENEILASISLERNHVFRSSGSFTSKLAKRKIDAKEEETNEIEIIDEIFYNLFKYSFSNIIGDILNSLTDDDREVLLKAIKEKLTILENSD